MVVYGVDFGFVDLNLVIGMGFFCWFVCDMGGSLVLCFVLCDVLEEVERMLSSVYVFVFELFFGSGGVMRDCYVVDVLLKERVCGVMFWYVR